MEGLWWYNHEYFGLVWDCGLEYSSSIHFSICYFLLLYFFLAIVTLVTIHSYSKNPNFPLNPESSVPAITRHLQDTSYIILHQFAIKAKVIYSLSSYPSFFLGYHLPSYHDGYICPTLLKVSDISRRIWSRKRQG